MAGSTGRRGSAWLTERLRERVQAGQWRCGDMIPPRRALVAEYQTALTTVERAVATLIAEGVLRADDRRGTYVADGLRPVGAAVEQRPAITATVGLVLRMVPYDDEGSRREQWPARILDACEHALSGQPGVTQSCVNLLQPLGRDLDPAAAARRLREERVDAVICIGEDAEFAGIQAELAGTGVPVVSARYDASADFAYQISIDSMAGGAMAAQHLRTRGYGPLVYLRPFTRSWVEARYAGARSAVGPGELTAYPAYPAAVGPPGDHREQAAAGAEVAHRLVRAGLAPGTGVLAPTDNVARAFAGVAAEAGLLAGRDYGIIGFDDRARESGISSLRPPLEQVGAEAARMVLRMLAGEAVASRIALPHHLIPRASTRPRAAPERS